MENNEFSSPAQLMEMVNSFRMSRIILTADELAIFDTIGAGGTSADSTATLRKTDPRATGRLMNALVSMGLLKKSGNLFFNTAFSGKFMVKSSPDYLGGLSLSNQTWKTWSTLTDAMRKGSTLIMETPINERADGWKEAFIAAMHARGARQAAETATALDLPATGRMLDVGGGSGTFAYAMIRKNPAIRATIFDLPNILPITEKYIRASGVSDKVDTLAGDYLRDSFGGPYDLVLMSAIIHINSPEENRLLLAKGATALNAGGQLVVIDHVMNDDRTEPLAGTVFALNMLVGTLRGDTYTQKEITGWMEEAGLTGIHLRNTPSGVQMMVGRK